MLLEFRDFTGGLNLEQSPYAIADNECVVCQNFIIDRFGLQRRKGFVRIDTIPSEQAFIITAYPIAQATNKFVLIYSNGAIWLYDVSDKSKFFIGNIILHVSPKIAEFENYICVAHGESLKLINLSNLQLMDTGSPQAVDVLVQFGRVVICGHDTVWFSGVGDPLMWDPNYSINPAMYFQIGYKDGGKIIGMTNFLNDIFVFKNTGLYRMHGFLPDITVYLVSRKKTTLSNTTYFSFGSEVISFDQEGLYQISSAFTYGDLIIDGIDGKIKSFLRQNFLGRIFYLPSLRAVVFNLRNNEFLLYFYQTKTFMTWQTDLNISHIVEQNGKIYGFGDYIYLYDGDYDSYSPKIADTVGIEIANSGNIAEIKNIIAVWQGKKIANTYPIVLKRVGVTLAKKNTIIDDHFLLRVGKKSFSWQVPKASKLIWDYKGIEIFGCNEEIHAKTVNLFKAWQYQRIQEFDIYFQTKSSLVLQGIVIEAEQRKN